MIIKTCYCKGFIRCVSATLAIVSLIAIPEIVLSDEVESSIARGGRLYDKWYAVIDADDPTESHPLYPTDKKYADKAKDNWRCKECHGWDYLGKDGAYAEGKHFSGIKGINGIAGADPATVIALLKGEPHGYAGKMEETDFQDLANFVTQGQIDTDQYIDRGAKMPINSDKTKGEVYFNTICATCHDKSGTKPTGMKPFGDQMGNPWEVMHKIMNGHPGEQMPAFRALDRQIAVDVMSYMTTLPKKE